MLHIAVLVILVKLAASVLDKDLHAKYLTMPKSEFINYFNKQDFSWKMTHYDHLDKKYLACVQMDSEALDKLPMQFHDLDAISDLPENFDAREKWPQCKSIGQIFNQGACGSCWTFGTATTASDRTCIHKDIHVNLAEQDFECLQINVCDGGYPSKAFDYWKSTGLVSQACKPYNIEELKANACIKECVNISKNYDQDKHFASTVYQIANAADQIKAELFKNGPIQASFEVYEDFYDYNSGIYEYKFGRRIGGHSVRVIGYGVESGIDYWLVANSWGEGWGLNGWFKLKAFQKELHFENGLLSGSPKN